MSNLIEKVKNSKRFASIYLNFLIFIFSTIGVTLSCVFACEHGYAHWYNRPMYFTQQSNVWIGVTCLIFGILLQKGDTDSKFFKVISVLKYIFTVSITVTGIIFCGLLAPFADYDVWFFSSVITHVVVPLLSILEFFIFRKIEKLKLRHVFYSIIPPLLYFVFASILGALRVDFGRGQAYPYFFLDFYSPVGMFGFKDGNPPQLGAFYWIIFFLLFILSLSFGYYKLYNYLLKRKQA